MSSVMVHALRALYVLIRIHTESLPPIPLDVSNFPTEIFPFFPRHMFVTLLTISLHLFLPDVFNLHSHPHSSLSVSSDLSVGTLCLRIDTMNPNEPFNNWHTLVSPPLQVRDMNELDKIAILLEIRLEVVRVCVWGGGGGGVWGGGGVV